MRKITVYGKVYYSVSVLCAGECLWTDLPLIKKVMAGARCLFPEVRYAYTTIPTYPCGQIGFVVASISKVGIYYLVVAHNYIAVHVVVESTVINYIY